MIVEQIAEYLEKLTGTSEPEYWEKLQANPEDAYRLGHLLVRYAESKVHSWVLDGLEDELDTLINSDGGSGDRNTTG
ncbi:MAG: hypothetical protein AAFQ74_10105 [Cyanobacteria bacterium J06623_4]